MNQKEENKGMIKVVKTENREVEYDWMVAEKYS